MQSKSGKLRKVAVVVSIIVIVLCLAVIIISLASLQGSHRSAAGEQTQTTPVLNSFEDSTDVNHLYPLTIDVSESESLVDLVALLETQNVYDGTPAYVFVGKKASQPDDELDALYSDEEKKQASAKRYMAAYSDLISFVRAEAADWSISYDEYVTYLSSCICIQNDDYIFVASGDKYQPLAEMFEQAINDPTVLDMEDLIARLTEFQLEG